MRKSLTLLICIAAALVGLRLAVSRPGPAAPGGAPPPVMSGQALPGGGQISSTMVGHEFRQDDLPAIAAAPDGSAWVAWLSWVGDRDDIGLRQWRDGQWSNLQWVPNTSGDSWLPQ